MGKLSHVVVVLLRWNNPDKAESIKRWWVDNLSIVVPLSNDGRC